MSNTLEIRLFGHPQVRWQGQPLDIKLPHKALALLYYLALAEQPVGRETLATLLWPDAPPPTAKQSLRNALSQLRPLVGDLLEINHRSAALAAPHRQQIDVVAFQQGLAAIQQTQQRGQPLDLALWQATLDLYRGDFLAGFYIHQSEAFEEWTTLCRESLRQQLLTHLLALSAAYAAGGAHAAALACLDRLLALEPDHEAAYSQQIQLLFSLGRRTEARQRYERYRKMLADELNLQPAPALTALLTEQHSQTASPATMMQRGVGVATEPTHTPNEPLPAPALPPAPRRPLTPPTLPNNLSRPLSAFVGRSQELVYLAQRLTDPNCRLLTIIGPGGMGKSSLALALGQRLLGAQDADFPDGIFFVPLADIGVRDDQPGEQTLADDTVSAAAILHAIAAQIGYKLEAGGSPAAQIQAYLRTRRLLLILDNFEHLLAGSEALVTLLSKAPQIKALITSRARLNVRGESVLTLDKLSLPTTAYQASAAAAQANPAGVIQPEVWQTSEAVAMFVQRAQQFDPAFTINAATIGPVGQICQLVEGLPLGIELATSMLPLLSCRALAKDLAKSLDFLAADTRDLPYEQRTLRAVFERSWRLLSPEEQLLLARLAIFPGSFRREAAEYIVGASMSLLQHLLNQSLVSKAGEERYTLHPTIHAFAQQKLQHWPEQIEAIQARYAHFYLEFLARLEQGHTEAVYATATEQIQADLDNVRTAWRWSVDQGNLALLELGVGSLQDFYRLAGIYPEAIQLLEAALPAVRHAVALAPAATGCGVRAVLRSGTAPWDGTGAQRLLARLLCYTAQFYRFDRQSGQVKKGESSAHEALELGRRLADPALQGLAYHELARLAQTRSDFAAMRRLSEQACTHACQANLPYLTAESLNDLGIAVSIYTHPLAGIQHFHEALDCLRQRPNRALEARIVGNLGYFHLAGHDYQSAYRYLQQRYPLQDREDSLITLIHFGDLWVMLGAYTEAQQEYAQGLAQVQARPAPYWESWLHTSYGRLQRLRGDPAAAQTACTLARQIAQKDGSRTVEQRALVDLGHALADLRDLVAAGSCYQQAIALQKEGNWLLRTPDAHAGLAARGLAQNEVATAVTHAEAALALLAQQGLAAAYEPFAVYWTCVRVLQAAGDPRTQTVLATAYQQLRETAHQLEDERLRRSFLENVVVNRNLVAAAQAAGIV